jgi:hypothetical protein
MKMQIVNIYAAVAGFFLATMAPVALAEQRVFFFGSSYTYFNGGMENMVQALLEEGLKTTVDARASSINEATLARHLQDLDGTNGNTVARQALITGNNTSWNLVVLQDQSTVPAYLFTEHWYECQEAGVKLNKWIETTGAVTMFLLTWGRQKGLGSDEFFPDYSKMQRYLNTGYQQYQLAANNPRSFVAPAGIAYQLVYDDTILAGGTDASSPFSNLYSGDGSNPSLQGSYLSACVIYAAYTGLSVAELEWAPEGIGAEHRDYLQGKADEAVFRNSMFYPHRYDVLDLAYPPDLPQYEPTATETSTAPGNFYMATEILLLAAIASVISMIRI